MKFRPAASALLLLSLLLFQSCKDKSSTEPSSENSGPAKYEIKELALPDNKEYRILSFYPVSENEAWASLYLNSRAKFYHLQDTIWTEYPSDELIHVDLFPCSIPPNHLLLFSGTNEMTFHYYNGSSWTKTIKPGDGKNNSFYDIYDLCGSASNKIFVAGIHHVDTLHRSYLLRYDGIEWKEMTGLSYRNSDFMKIVQIPSTSSFLLYGTQDQETTWRLLDVIYLYDGNNHASPVYKREKSSTDKSTLFRLGRDIYYTTGLEYYKYSANTFTQIFSGPGSLSKKANLIRILCGSGEQDFFYITRKDNYNYELYHYNGTHELLLPGVSIEEGAIFGNTVYFHSRDKIYRGRRTE